MMKGVLSFRALREANIARLPKFKDGMGRPCHAIPDGSDWSPAEWLLAVMGELGELANDIKKVRRGDFDMNNPAVHADIQGKISREFADIVTYLDISAMQLGIDLGEATRIKFNEVSRKQNLDVFIQADDRVVVADPGQMELEFDRPVIL